MVPTAHSPISVQDSLLPFTRITPSFRNTLIGLISTCRVSGFNVLSSPF